MRRTWDQHFMAIASEMAKMSTCVRREVGCVLIDGRNRIVGTGFNGVPPRDYHCDPRKTMYNDGSDVRTCPGAVELPPGLSDRPTTGVRCRANHAERNAFLHLSCDPWDATTCYTTLSPCFECVKMIMCSGISRIVFLEEYEVLDARDYWLDNPTTVNRLAPTHLSYKQRTWEKLEVVK
jgi:dCMP deaminase